MSGELAVRLGSCEAVIELGMQTFMEVGKALAEIRDSRLYRVQFATFEDYCADRWGFTASRARQIIGASETATNVTLAGGPAPATESQARELSGLPAEQAAAVMHQAWEQKPGKVTAGAIREAREEIAPRSNPPVTGLISSADLAELNGTNRREPSDDRGSSAPTVEPSPGELARAVEEYVASDPAVQRARMAKSFADAWTAALALTNFDQFEVAAVLNSDDWDTLEHVFDHIASWWTDLRVHHARGLRVVGGKDV